MRSFSIRNRVLLASVVLVAIGLLVADGATYTLLRSSLYSRVDRQLRGAVRFAGPALNGAGRIPDFGFADQGQGPVAPLYELLDTSGKLVANSSPAFGPPPAPPRLPQNLPGSAAVHSGPAIRFLTTGSIGSPTRYRVLAGALGDGGTLIVALPLRDADATLHGLLLVEGLVTLAVLLGLAVLARWAIEVGLRPLKQMERTAVEIAGGDLSKRVEAADSKTEAGRLGLALNSMLEQIESAFNEQRAAESKLRRFVADASHELRTPLTSIRGYAELFRRGADARPDDLAKTMRRIEEESARMGTLVDELLLLARLDQGPPIEGAPVDLAKVAADAVEDARAVQPDRPISGDYAEPVVIEGDEPRLRQVAANLLSNALEHTPLEAAVHVKVSKNGQEATLEVADEGPGLDEEDAGKIFDRFYRVDPARSRDNGGAGLGLSIVAAIVHAHGGEVSVETAPGAGARFFIRLPIAKERVETTPETDPAEQSSRSNS